MAARWTSRAVRAVTVAVLAGLTAVLALTVLSFASP